jgi:uncharacterized membrane protein
VDLSIDWTQFITDLLVGLVLMLIAGIVAYVKSDRFRSWASRIMQLIAMKLRWAIRQWKVILLLSIIGVVDYVVAQAFGVWLFAFIAIANLLGGVISLMLLSPSEISSKKKITFQAGNSYFVPLPIRPSIGNGLIRNRYLDFPTGSVILAGKLFEFMDEALLFDTNGQLRYSRKRDDGSIEVDFQIDEAIHNVKAVHILINSGNSRQVYYSQAIGGIILLFKDVPPFTVDFILGNNIREWCIGNPGDFVREVSSDKVQNAWSGTNTEGTNAIVDCLDIPVPDPYWKLPLMKIAFIHKSKPIPPDEMGVHYSIFGITLEIDLGEGN